MKNLVEEAKQLLIEAGEEPYKELLVAAIQAVATERASWVIRDGLVKLADEIKGHSKSPE